jgi:hypothetical protein
VKDANGNDLKAGDIVHVKLGLEWATATISRIQDGGIAVTGVPKNRNDQVGVTPDALVLQIAVMFSGAPGQPQASVLKLVAPNAAESIIKSSLTM